MVHQSHNIPWRILASNLSWGTTKHRGDKVTNLHPRATESRGKQLTYFIKAFVGAIEEHSVSERQKYPSSFDPVEPSDILLSQATAQKIAPTVRKWRGYGFKGHCPSGVCNTTVEKVCRCAPIPDEERRVAAFLRPHGPRECYEFFRKNSDAFFNIEIVKTLLLYGEMDTLLRVCALPDVELAQWWQDAECQCEIPVLGWDQVCIKALRAYICLNTIDVLPELWDSMSGASESKDYRHSRFYQYTLRTCTGTGQLSEVSTYPHRLFFGIGDNQFQSQFHHPRIRRAHWLRWETPSTRYCGDMISFPQPNHYGKVPINEFLTLENKAYMGYQPSSSSITLVQSYLFKKGLPAELILKIMDLANYERRGRLSEPHGPFHAYNREELEKYLTYCWLTIVRCETMAKALGMKIPWEELIADCIVDFWASDRDGLGSLYWYARDEEGFATRKVFVKP
ncbi:hypothetical protein PDE_03293 [Penicillium oxalicum 114-2]|uniref:Uncharacterized protein n=1 Tax=Penicillium oxalicum (strain 114-2 / CGMCC 5302) TaxID=933388 RepID=S8B1W5_PENO1|nr:hypothetical protein PDE_03293 [Penicillium oxalicum 114-2]